MQSSTDYQKILVLRRGFEDSIEEFGKFFFKNHTNLETPQFHKDIYQTYQGFWKAIAIAAPRGHGKSSVTDLVYLAWVITNKKAKFILLVSDTYSQAVLFLEGLKAELESNERLKDFYGTLTSDKWSEGEIITNGIMIKAIGAGMKVRGLKFRENRPDLIIVDDLENDDLVESKDRREKLERWFNGALIPSMNKEGRIIVIGTILHYDSLLHKLLQDDKYEEYYKVKYSAITNGKALWPEHLDTEELENIKQDYIKRGQGYLFYQEYQNDPVSDENRKFKIEKIRYYEESDIDKLNTKCFITIDRAYSMDKTADYTGIVINRVDKENNWYIRSERFKGTEKELIEKIFDLKSYFKPVKIAIEQKAFEYTIKPALTDEMRKRNTFFTIEELKDAGSSKTRRIEGLSPRYESGAIHFLREDVDMIDEMIKFPRSLHDDLLDALAYQLDIAVAPTTKKLEEQNILKRFDAFKNKQQGYFPYKYPAR